MFFVYCTTVQVRLAVQRGVLVLLLFPLIRLPAFSRFFRVFSLCDVP